MQNRDTESYLRPFARAMLDAPGKVHDLIAHATGARDNRPSARRAASGDARRQTISLGLSSLSPGGAYTCRLEALTYVTELSRAASMASKPTP